MKKHVFIYILLLFLLLASCTSKPADTEAETVVESSTAPVSAEETGAPVTTEETTEETAKPEEKFAVLVNGETALDLLDSAAYPMRVNGELTVETVNTTDNKITQLYLFCDGEPLILADGRAECEGEITVCAKTADGALFASEASLFDEAENEFIMTADMSADELTLTKPFTLITNGHKLTADIIVFSADNAGKMIIKNEENAINCRRVICETPLWDYEIDSLFSDFTEAGRCFINADTVNGTLINKEELVIDGEEKLAYFVSDGVFAIPDGVKSVIIKGEFTLPDFEIREPVSLTFKENIGFGRITLSYDGEGAVSVDTSENQKALYGHINVYLPGASLIWNGPDAPDAEEADRYFTVREYNGKTLDSLTGGDSALYISEATVGGIKGKADGFYITLTVPYHIDLPNEKSSVECSLPEGCKATLSLKGENLYLTVTDGERRCGYRLILADAKYYLPVIYIDTADGKSVTSDTEYAQCSVTVDYNGYENSDEFDNIFAAPCLIRGRGHSSWKLDKKPYKLKFENKVSLFGLTEAKKWVLQANHVDKSLMRNTVAMSVGAVLDNMLFVPHSYLVDVFVNGFYVGVYSLTEQIEIKDGRIEGETGSEELDTDYLLELGEDANKTSFGTDTFTCELTKFAQIKSPDIETLSKEQYDFIKAYVKKADAAVKALDNYEEYIDVDSLIDWFILHELSYNVDCSFRRSVYILKRKEGKLYLASPWDFDYAFGNFYLDPDDPEGWICLGNELTDNYKEYIKTNWMDYLLKDEAFLSKLKIRWEQVKDQVLEAAENSIDRLKAQCAPSADSNFKVWKNVLGNKIQFEKRSTAKISTYDGNAEYLRTFIEKRFKWMDEEISKY